MKQNTKNGEKTVFIDSNILFKHHKSESSESAGEQRRNDINNEVQLGTSSDTVQQWMQNKT